MSDRGGVVVRGRSRTGEDRINFRRYHKFVSFMTSFLDYSKDLCIHILKLSFEINHRDPSYMTWWIHNAVMRLDLVCDWSYLVAMKMDPSVYTPVRLWYP